MHLYLKQNDSVISNQLKSKLLYKHVFESQKLKTVRLNINLNKLKSFNEDIILESLFLLEFLTSLKSYISFYKRMYQEVHVQLSNTLRSPHFFYFFTILKMFYFPILNRRNLVLADSFDKSFNYTLKLNSVNTFPFVPDIYFKWNLPINCFIIFNSQNKAQSKLFLHYFNFPINN